jgi:AraC family transcriptional regulator
MANQFQHLRARYYDADPVRARALGQYHLREREVAGLIATETRHPRHFRIPSHSHELHSFYVVLDGALTEFSRDAEWVIDGHSVVFTPAGHVHHNAFHDDGGRCFLVEFTSPWIERFSASGVRFDQPRLVVASDVALLARRLYAQFRDPDPGWTLTVEGLALEILASFLRESHKRVADDLPRWLSHARDLLQDHPTDRLSLAGIAAEVGVHPVHLARTFRKRFRCTLGEYQRRVRIERAARQLTTNELSLAEIALANGFVDQAHFTRVFKSLTGWSPGKYRTALRGG